MQINYLLIFCIILIADRFYAQNWLKIDSIFNPSGVIVQNFSAPFFCDIDADGDFDLFLGSTGDRVEYFENIGTKTNPKFFRDTTVLYSIYSGAVGTNSYYPVLADLDNDKDYDLVIGGFNGLLFYKNIGDSLQPIWQKDTTIFNIINQMIGNDPKPAFADLDGDSDLDLLIGIGESILGGPTPGITMGFRNIGTPTNPIYSIYSSFVANISDIGRNSFPALADLDKDGDYDLLLGRDLQTFVYYQNTGTPNNPTWSQNTSLFAGIETTTYWKNPTFCDLDGDLDLDLIYGQSAGRLYFYKNVGSLTNPSFQYDPSYFLTIRIDGNSSTVSFADFDNDGNFDLLSGIWTGRFQYFKNNGNRFNPAFQLTTTSFSNINPGSYSSPVFVDLDKDGDFDIVSGALSGRVFYYVNNNGTFSQNTTIFSAINVSGFSIPAFCDIDGDNDDDLLVGAEQAINIRFYENSGNYQFVENNSFMSGVTFPNYSRPTFSDIDNDGDFDLIIGKIDGGLIFFENKGTRYNPNWLRNDTLFQGIKVKQNSHPGFADLDGDGRKDLVLGEYDGNFTFFKNLFAFPTSVERPKNLTTDFKLEQNFPNPFNEKTKIKFSIPDFSSHSNYFNEGSTYQELNHKFLEQKIKSNPMNLSMRCNLVTLKVYDILGREVASLIEEEKEPGIYEVEFNASKLPSGIYFYQLKVGKLTETKKMLLIK